LSSNSLNTIAEKALVVGTDLIQKTPAEQMLEVYHATNEFRCSRGVAG
jgi:hypothetical protein